MKEQTQITVILPVHKLDDATRPLFTNAIKSVEEQIVRPDSLLVVVPKGSDVSKELSSYDYNTGSIVVELYKAHGLFEERIFLYQAEIHIHYHWLLSQNYFDFLNTLNRF